MTGPVWYKDAVIYQLHVKSFFDSNNDGVGDFAGLIEKLDYIEALGVTAIWLLPFYPSPRRDDGYDISDFRGVHPDYGTLEDVRRFIEQAHRRNLRVITELVVNHSSDQHPWFQRARLAPPGSPERDFYVWSDTDQKYPGTRIIFLDTEKSNWTWDETAKAFYWHRFFAHQPDLNFDNPAVLEEVLDIMRFWLDLGVDGLRLDAVPYLIERDGTNNENLPETHAVLKKIRAALDAYAPDRMLLAEANQWPEDAQAYFGDGDECHMSFHFPLMPRMYMAIAQEDRFPITDIMRQTPAIPEACQWAIFLRNHDELTLEMVTDSERDYLWNTYAADKRARLNLGIRRRLAPLMEHDRRRIELMNALLLSMPGTPVIYYGDEIGMGDNLHLGDRDGVRTPMQWSPDRNGGFSRRNPADLVLPPVMDAVYGFEAVNVEAQSSDQYSMLSWTRRMLAVRRRHAAFGRGAQVFLFPGNRKVLAFLRTLQPPEGEAEAILCVYNLARNAQAVELELRDYEGYVPVDALGGSAFPPIGQLNYLLTLPPFGFYWFSLAREAALPPWHVPAPEALPELSTLVLRHGLEDVLAPNWRHMLETEALPGYLRRRRWFNARGAPFTAPKLLRGDKIPGRTTETLFTQAAVSIGGRTERYHLPLGIFWEGESNAPLPQQLALARVRQGRRVGYLTDAFALDGFAPGLIRALRAGLVIKVEGGEIICTATPQLEAVTLLERPELRRLDAEQANGGIILDEAVILKLIRRVTPGINPEVEMARHLTAHGFAHVPALLGEVVMREDDGTTYSMIVAESFVPNQGDAWQYTQDYLARFTEQVAIGGNTEADEADLQAGYASFARALGTRLAELHNLLAKPSADPAFAPRLASEADAAAWAAGLAKSCQAAIAHAAGEDDPSIIAALDILRARQSALLTLAAGWARAGIGSTLTRVQGDLHLGQILLVNGDAYIAGFGVMHGQDWAVLRQNAAPLRDLARLLRSLDEAASGAGPAPAGLAVQPTAAPRARFAAEMSAQIIAAYRAASQQWGPDNTGFADLLDLFLAESWAAAVLAAPPAAARVPLWGLAGVAARRAND